MSQASPLLIAQVTDTHLFADASEQMLGVPTRKTFQAVLERLQKLVPKPDVLLLTGDLSQDETPESYGCLQDLLRPLEIPTYWLPGNHDKPLVMEQVLNQAPISPQKSFQAGGWLFLLLNSAVPGCVHGQVSLESLEWLESQLQRTEKPTLIALHHPPLLINSAWMDRIKLQNSEELLAVVDRYPQIRLVVFGHIHQEFERSRHVHYLGTPSTCCQFIPQSDKLTLDKLEPGFRLITLYPNGTFETKVERVAYGQQLDLATIR